MITGELIKKKGWKKYTSSNEEIFELIQNLQFQNCIPNNKLFKEVHKYYLKYSSLFDNQYGPYLLKAKIYGIIIDKFDLYPRSFSIMIKDINILTRYDSNNGYYLSRIKNIPWIHNETYYKYLRDIANIIYDKVKGYLDEDLLKFLEVKNVESFLFYLLLMAWDGELTHEAAVKSARYLDFIMEKSVKVKDNIHLINNVIIRELEKLSSEKIYLKPKENVWIS